MPASPALTRLSSGHYNTGDWNATTNQGGMGGDGHRQALVPPKPPQTGSYPVLTSDIAAVAAEITGNVDAAASSAQAAAAALIATQTAATQAIANIGTLATGLMGGDTVQAISNSTLTTAVGVPQVFQVPAGKAYLAGMPVRFAARPPATVILDGRIDSYDRTTGAGTFTALRFDGTGSAASWNVMLIGQPVEAVGGYQAYLTEVPSLAQWETVTISTPGIASQAAARRRVVTVLEAGVSPQAFTNIDPFNFADRTKFSFAQTVGSVGLTIPVAWQSQTGVNLGSSYWSSKNSVQILDMAPTIAVIIWLASDTLSVQVVNYANPSAPTLGTVNNLTSGLGFSQFRAVRINTSQFGIATYRSNGYIGGVSCYLSGNSVGSYGSNYSGWQSGYSDGDSNFSANFSDITFAISATGGTNARAHIPATRSGSSGTYYGWMEVYFYTSGASITTNGNLNGLNLSGVSSSLQFCPLHTGALMAVGNGVLTSSYNSLPTGTRFVAFSFLGSENAGNLTVLDCGGTLTPFILGAGPCASDSGAEAWVAYGASNPAATSTVRFAYVTISRSGSTLTASAPIFDAAAPASPPWYSTLNTLYDGYPGHTYAYRRTGGLALRLAGTSIATLDIQMPAHLSNNRAWGFTIPDGNSMIPVSFSGAQAVLASGNWQGGDIGRTLYLPGGTARIASVSLGTATLERASGSILGTTAGAGAWFLSPLFFSGGHILGSAETPVIATAAAGQLNARRWKSFNGVTAVASGSVFITFSFDNRRTWRVLSGGVSRIIASDRAADHGGTDGVWYARSSGSGWSGPKADMLTALRDAIAAGGANQTAPSAYASATAMNQTGWTAGWNATVDYAFYLANPSASVDSLTVSYSTYEQFRPVDGASIQLRSDDLEGVMVTRIAAGSSTSLRIHVQY